LRGYRLATARKLFVQPTEPIRVRLPDPHQAQEPFVYWSDLNPEAQCLVAPAGTKTGKSFGASLWLARENLEGEGLYSVWIGPTMFKSRIGYRYMLRMLPDCGLIDTSDRQLTISLANNCYIQCLHGRDAEVTVEGEAIDRFVIDEAGKQKRQLWYSLLTTLTQTGGKGIVTGTPRGFGWYRDIFLQAQAGDPFFAWVQLKTESSPYVLAKAIAQAKRLLPPALFAQYYEAVFVSMSTVFGDLSGMWSDVKVDQKAKLWVHPDVEARALDVSIGVDWAKKRDWTVFYATNAKGECVGFYRTKGVGYPEQVRRLKIFCKHFKGEVSIRHDKTGVGEAIDDMIAEAGIDANVDGVTFTNSSKSAMVTKVILAIEHGWHRAPRIGVIETEFNSYEVQVTRTGIMTFSAPDGEHDDVVSAAALSISGAYEESLTSEAEKVLAEAMGDKVPEDPTTDKAALQLFDDLAGDDDEDLANLDPEAEAGDDTFDFDPEMD
jgi:hypothetical protein